LDNINEELYIYHAFLRVFHLYACGDADREREGAKGLPGFKR
jgi:hypothetical protein